MSLIFTNPTAQADPGEETSLQIMDRDPDCKSRFDYTGRMDSLMIGSNIDRWTLGVDPFGQIQRFPTRIERIQGAALVNLDLRIENDLDVDSLVDLRVRTNSIVFDPADFQGDRDKIIDLETELIWGYRIAPDAFLRLDTTGIMHQDRLYPDLEASTGRIGASVVQELTESGDITFDFDWEATSLAQPTDSGYTQTTGRLFVDFFRPFAYAYKILPAHVSEPAVPEEFFEYSRELGLSSMKPLLPLGAVSTIRPFIGDVEEPDPTAQHFKQILSHRDALTHAEIGFATRDYPDTGVFSDFKRYSGNLRSRIAMTREFTLDLDLTSAYQDLVRENTAAFLSTYWDTGFTLGFAQQREGFHQGLTGRFRTLRFPNVGGQDFNRMDLRYSSVTAFGERYWLLSSAGIFFDRSLSNSLLQPDRKSLTARVRLLVDLKRNQNLSFTYDRRDAAVEGAANGFDVDFTEESWEASYHRPIRGKWSIELGGRVLERRYPLQESLNRDESLVFMKSQVRM